MPARRRTFLKKLSAAAVTLGSFSSRRCRSASTRRSTDSACFSAIIPVLLHLGLVHGAQRVGGFPYPPGERSLAIARDPAGDQIAVLRVITNELRDRIQRLLPTASRSDLVQPVDQHQRAAAVQGLIEQARQAGGGRGQRGK